jgi:predicted XRE-type DNA-binding protein
MPKTKKEKQIEVFIGSGNVFKDLGFETPEEEKLKAQIASLVNESIEVKGWTQAQTAEKLGIKQPHVSELSRGQLKRFSVERLMIFLTLLDQQVTIKVKHKKLPTKQVLIQVGV